MPEKQHSSEGGSSKKEILERLVEQARKDPAFFHALVFEPEKVLTKIDYADRYVKGSIVAIRPEDVIAGLAGLGISGTGEVAVCGISCEPSCGDTCGEGSCFGTCLSGSCDRTCGAGSCDITSQIARQFYGDPVFSGQFSTMRRSFRAIRR